MITIDKKIYDDEKEFIKDVRWREGLGDTFERERIIIHEKDHFKKLREKGYTQIKYASKRIIVNLGFIKIFRDAYTVKPKEEIKPEDVKEICLAPENPGLTDRFYGSKIGNFLYKITFNMRRMKLVC